LKPFSSAGTSQAGTGTRVIRVLTRTPKPPGAAPPLTAGTGQNFLSSAPHQSTPVLLPSLGDSQLRTAAAEGEPRALRTHACSTE